MSRTKWTYRERQVAHAIGGRRYPANTGARIDVESDGHVIQVKERKVRSLPPKIGSVWVKRSAGRGVVTPWLVIMTEAMWRAMNGRTPMEDGKETRRE